MRNGIGDWTNHSPVWQGMGAVRLDGKSGLMMLSVPVGEPRRDWTLVCSSRSRPRLLNVMMSAEAFGAREGSSRRRRTQKHRRMRCCITYLGMRNFLRCSKLFKQKGGNDDEFVGIDCDCDC